MRKKKRNIITQLKKNNHNPITKKPLIRKSDAKQASRDKLGSPSISSFVMDRAQELQASLSPEFPSFLKPVHWSNTAGRFCVYLPKEFCEVHLPNYDETVILVDGNEQEFRVKYVVLRNKLDGGWRGFANSQKLMEGDVLVFHLIDHCKFKVYIVRAAEANGALGLLNLDFHAKPIHDTDQNGNGNGKDKFDLNDPEFIRFPKYTVNSKNMKCSDDYEICVDGVIFYSEIPRRLRKKYYELCCSQERFLHENIIEGLNSKLATGMISEATIIADGIRASSISTSLQQLKYWDNTLEAIEILGMSVNFLRARLHKLIKVSSKYKLIAKSKSEKRNDSDFIDFEALELKSEKLSFKFKELAGASW